tara:strand:- start:2736 stop:4028 length:1293 start_codon:yes stop_codon:yes gene_type:complete
LINKIAHTLGSRFIVAIFNLVLLFITTRIMGAEMKGLISLFILNLSLTSIISGFIGGPAIVYLAPRQSIGKIFSVNIVWILITVSLTSIVLLQLGMMTSIEPIRFFRLAFMECLIVTLSMVLLGREKITTHNIIQVVKVATSVVLLAVFLKVNDDDFLSFLNAYEISLLITAVLSIIYSFKFLKPNGISSWVQTLASGFRLGSIVQTGNLAQLLNYRIGYYVLEMVISPIEIALIRIGIFSASLQIAEALWQFTRSVNTVQYASISNIQNRSQALILSLKLVRMNYAVTAIGIIFLLLIPSDFYGFAFGSEFSEIKTHFMILSPGILALAFGGGVNHYFAGLGEHRYNTTSTIVGLSVSIAIIIPLTKILGTHGAALTASIVYCVQAICQVYFLYKRDGIRPSAFYLTNQDWNSVKSLLTRLWNRKLEDI